MLKRLSSVQSPLCDLSSRSTGHRGPSVAAVDRKGRTSSEQTGARNKHPTETLGIQWSKQPRQHRSELVHVCNGRAGQWYGPEARGSRKWTILNSRVLAVRYRCLEFCPNSAGFPAGRIWIRRLNSAEGGSWQSARSLANSMEH